MMKPLRICFGVVFSFCAVASVVCDNSKNSSYTDPSFNETALVKIYPEQSVNAQVYKPFALICLARSEYNEEITHMEWRDNRGRIIVTRLPNSGVKKLSKNLLKLMFSFPLFRHSGVYTCSATYSNNETSEAKVVVNFYEEITFISCYEQQRLSLGASGQIICTTSGNPVPQTIWLKDGAPITSDPRYTISAGKLSISQVTEDMQGLYTAEAFILSVGQFKSKVINVTIEYPENKTTCPPNNFRCLDGSCIRTAYVCNGFDDCHDGSDEVNCTSRPSCSFREFRCDNGRCVRLSDVCDGRNDCGDWSDERRCLPTTTTSRPCSYFEFRCNNGRCVHKNYICDGDNDCGDWSDERNCRSTERFRPSTEQCAFREYRCDNGNCINRDYVCDGDNDCGDWSDERSCGSTRRPSCGLGMFTCRNRRCIRARYVCDGDNDCGDFSDELDCQRAVITNKNVRSSVIIGISVGISVLVLIFIITVWCVVIRKLRKKRETALKTVDQTPQPHPDRIHAAQVAATQNNGSQEHVSGQMFHQSPTAGNLTRHHATHFSSPDLRQPAVSPEITQQHGHLQSNIHPDRSHVPQPEVQQIPQSNLYPTLPQQAYPTAPENSA